MQLHRDDISDLLEETKFSTDGSNRPTRSKQAKPTSAEPANQQLQTPEPTPEPTVPITPSPITTSGSDEQLVRSLEQLVDTSLPQLSRTFPSLSVPAKAEEPRPYPRTPIQAL